MSYLLLFLLLLFFPLNSHDCPHNKGIIPDEHLPIPSLPSLHPFLGGSLPGFDPLKAQPIRIVFETSGLNQPFVSQDLKNLIEQDLLPLAHQYYATKLKVIRKNSNIVFPSNQKRCQVADIPEAHRKEGVDADLVLYVTATNEPRDTYLAWATPCLMGDESVNFRPLAGQINYNAPKMKRDLKLFEKQMFTTIHEMLHVIVFNPRLFGQYRTRAGERRQNVLKDVKLRGMDTTLLTTPKLVQTAREHFGCPDLEGVELENEGGYGSIGAHFERAILNNEIMTASIGSELSFSKFSMALLEDSGWYDVDHSKADPFYFGRKRGCDFINKGCQGDNKPREFCFEDKPICSFSYYEKGFCFSKDPYSDKCGYVSTLNMDSKDCRVYQAPRQINIYGESYGPNSKCVNSDISIKGWTSSEDPVRCMEYKCVDDKVLFFINGKQAAVCTKEFEKVQAPAGYQGQIECPDPEAFCLSHYLLCPNKCSGKGYCFKGQCECLEGFSGTDCSGDGKAVSA